MRTCALFCSIAAFACAAPALADSRTGALAAKVIFKADTSSGSFNGASGGTAPGLGNGVQALRLFKPDGSNTLLATGTSDTKWPKWIKRVELGISGAANTAATYPNCAKFTHPSETSVSCSGVACAGPSGFFRVSEKDCTNASATGCNAAAGDPVGAVCKGDGDGGDGIYVRVHFDRTAASLGTDENILAILEYQASNLKRDSANPTSCYTPAGVFDVARSGCTDQVWQVFLRKDLTTEYSPFMMVVPPSQGWIETSPAKMGGPRTTKQFILPLASDSTLEYLQISRIRAGNDDTLMSSCVANSPLCLGMILYSLSLFRI